MIKKYLLSWLGRGLLIFLMMSFGVNYSLAAINFEGASSAVNADGGATSLTIPAPSGIQSGELLFAAIGVVDGASVTITPPAGWNLVVKNNNGNISLATYYKIAGGAEPANYTWSFGAFIRRAEGGIARYSGVDTINPLDDVVAGSDNKVQNQNVTAPAANASLNGALVLRVFALNRGLANFHNYSVGLTERVDIAHSFVGGGTLAFADLIQPLAGSTGTATVQGDGYTFNRPFAIQTVVFKRLVLPPTVLGAVAKDANENGKIDTIVVEFSEDVNDLGTYNVDPVGDINPGIVVSGYDVISKSGNGTNILTYTLAEGSVPDTDATPGLTWNSVNIKDLDSDDLDLTGAPTNARDGAGPAIVSAVSLNPSQFEVVFSEPINDLTLNVTDFDLDFADNFADGNPGSILTGSMANDEIIIVGLGGGGIIQPDENSGTVKFTAVDVLDDLAVLPNGNTQTLSVAVNDGIVPTIDSLIFYDVDNDGFVDYLNAYFSENMNSVSSNYVDGFSVDKGCLIVSASGGGVNLIQFELAGCNGPDTALFPTLSYDASMGDVEDLNGNELGNFSFLADVDGAVPVVRSITRNGVNPTNDQILEFLVRFTEPVSGVDVTDFNLFSTGPINGFSIVGVNPVGDDYLVTVDRGVDVGTLGLELVDDDSIEDVIGNKLNGGFSGEEYTISGGNLINVNVQPVLLTAGSVTNVNVLFTTINSIPADGKIKVNFGSNFDLTGVSSVGCSSMDGTFGFSVSGNEVRIERQGDGSSALPGDQVCLIQGVKNPSFAGSTGIYSVVTTDNLDGVIDDEPVVPADMIVPNILNATSVSGSSLIQGQQSNVSVFFTTQNGLENNDKIEVVFPAGFGLGSIGGAVCATMDGVVNVGVSGQVVTLTRSGGSFQSPGAESCLINGVINPNVVGPTGTFTITTKRNSGEIRDTKSGVVGLNIEQAPVVQQGGGGGGGGGAASFGKAACSGESCFVVNDKVKKGEESLKDENKSEELKRKFERRELFFKDVLTSNSSWALEYIEKLREKCGIEGYKDGDGNLLREFRPDGKITRRELVKMVMKCKGVNEVVKAEVNPFEDVLLSDWGVDEIALAKKIGMIEGYPGTNNFRPNDLVLRAEAAKIIILANFKEEEIKVDSLEVLKKFTDVVAGQWYERYLMFGVEKGFFSGYEGLNLFGPGDSLTRAQAAKIIAKVFGL